MNHGVATRCRLIPGTSILFCLQLNPGVLTEVAYHAWKRLQVLEDPDSTVVKGMVMRSSMHGGSFGDNIANRMPTVRQPSSRLQTARCVRHESSLGYPRSLPPLNVVKRVTCSHRNRTTARIPIGASTCCTRSGGGASGITRA